jgi:hypothetical protein
MSAIGYHAGLARSGRSLAILARVLAFSAVMTLIADIDRPQEGLLRVSPQPLMDLQRSVSAPGHESAFAPPAAPPILLDEGPIDRNPHVSSVADVAALDRRSHRP